VLNTSILRLVLSLKCLTSKHAEHIKFPGPVWPYLIILFQIKFPTNTRICSVSSQLTLGSLTCCRVGYCRHIFQCWCSHTVNPVMQDRVTKLSCTVLPVLKYNGRQVKWRRLTYVLEFSPAESLVWCWQPT
jgi:hypothetical protein